MPYPLIEGLIRDVRDFPQPGIVFKDITPILKHPEAFAQVLDALYRAALPMAPDAVVGIESRGFVFGAPLALLLKKPFIPVRKVGKLPAATMKEEYNLEYGSTAIEIHADALSPGDGVIIIDDVLATGGTAAATCRLVERLGAGVLALGFVIELDFLNGRKQLGDRPVVSLVNIT